MKFTKYFGFIVIILKYAGISVLIARPLRPADSISDSATLAPEMNLPGKPRNILRTKAYIV
jgi:hypothetical protein